MLRSTLPTACVQSAKRCRAVMPITSASGAPTRGREYARTAFA